MDDILSKAYEKVFDGKPENIMDWQIAERLMGNFKVPLLGDELAKQCILRIVNHIVYPNNATMTRIVGRAEGFASELWDELPDEPHMAEIARLEHREDKKKLGPKKELVSR